MIEVKVGDRVKVFARQADDYAHGFSTKMVEIINADEAVVLACEVDGSYRIGLDSDNPWCGFWFSRKEFKLLPDVHAEKPVAEATPSTDKLPKLYALIGDEGVVGVYPTRKAARRNKAYKGGKANGYKIHQYTCKKEVR